MSSADDARLSDIENRLEALEGLSPTDTLSPNYLTLNPDGSVGATFSGLIDALGLVIPEFTAGVATGQNEITWVRRSDGAVVAHIEGGHGATSAAQLNVTADGSNAGDSQGSLNLNAKSSSGTVQLGVQSTPSGGGQDNVFVVLPSGKIRFVAADDGSSSFPQFSFPFLCISGQTTLTWPGGSDQSNVDTIALPGATNQCFCLALPFTVGTSKFPTLAYQSLANGVNLFGQTPGVIQGAGVTVNAYYLLFGT